MRGAVLIAAAAVAAALLGGAPEAAPSSRVYLPLAARDATATPTATATPAPTATPAHTVRLVRVVGAPPGGAGTAEAETSPHASCGYTLSSPGRPNEVSPVPKNAGPAGRVAFTVHVPPSWPRGTATLLVECGRNVGGSAEVWAGASAPFPVG